MSIEQLIEDLDLHQLREICERAGYRFSEHTSEKCLRATVLDDYERGDLSGKDIRAVVDSRDERIEAANAIMADLVNQCAALFGQNVALRERIAELEGRVS